MKNKEKKINLCMYILLLLFVQVILCDNILYFFKLNYIVSNIIALVFNIILSFFLVKKKVIKIENNYNHYDWIFFILLFIVTISSIMFPDTFWDTYSYHIYLQENPFANKIQFDFFPGRTLTSFVFPIADRIYYMFRFVLGFRLGTVVGYFLLLIMFYQNKKILESLIGNKIDKKYLSILAIIPLCSFVILQQLGSYYIDNFSIVLMMELFYIVIFERKNIIESKPKLYYLFLIVGLFVAVKITNLVYVVIPALVLLIKNIKNLKKLKLYDFPIIVILLLLPMLPYLVDCIKQTGSPVYPYYNTVFKSKYFSNENWLDTRYGPKNIGELIKWPIYIMNHPGLAYETANTDGFWYFGYITIIIYILNCIYIKYIKKESIDKNCLLYCLVLFGLYIFWAKFVIGYTRYGMAIPMLSCMFILKLFVENVNKKNFVYIIVFTYMIGLSMYLGCNNYLNYKDTAIKYYFNKDDNIITLMKENTKKLFSDINNEKYDIDGIWGAIYDDSGVPTLINVDDRIMHLEYGFKTTPNKKTEDIYWNNINNNNIYIPLHSIKIDNTINCLSENGFEIKEIVGTMHDVSFLGASDYIYIARIEYVGEEATNTKDEFNADNELTKEISNDSKKIKSMIGLKDKFADGSKVEIIGIKGLDEEIITTINIETNEKFLIVDESIEDEQYEKIKFRVVKENNNDLSDDQIVLLNLRYN